MAKTGMIRSIAVTVLIGLLAGLPVRAGPMEDALLLREQGKIEDAFDATKKLAETDKTHIRAVVDTAAALEAGIGTDKNEAEAVRLYQQAIAQKPATVAFQEDIVRAQKALARMLIHGRGTAPNLDEALRLLTLAKAVDDNQDTLRDWAMLAGPKGDKDALFWLYNAAETGYTDRDGTRIAPDPKEAERLLGEAETARHPTARFMRAERTLRDYDDPALVAGAVQTLAELARQGDARAHARLGEIYDAGVLVEKDSRLSEYHYRQAALRGDTEAEKTWTTKYPKTSHSYSVYLKARDLASTTPILAKAMLDQVGPRNLFVTNARIGELYIAGLGPHSDPIKAEPFLKSGALGGDVEAAYLLGKVLLEKKTLGIGYDALKLMEVGADVGNIPDAQYLLGKALKSKGTAERIRAANFLTRASKQGHPDAMYELGLMYEGGSTVPKLPYKALSLYEQAASQGHEKASYRLAQYYHWGGGGREIDYSKAMELYEAAGPKNMPARTAIGQLFESGNGVPVDLERAAKLYAEAAEGGNARAQYLLAWAYQHGRGVGKDDAQAIAWYRKAAMQNLASPQLYLAQMLEKGEGAPKNLEESLSWYIIAAERKADGAQEGVLRLTNALSTDEVSKAKTQVTDLRTQIPGL